MKKMTLGSKLLIGGICLVLLPLVCVSWFSIIQSTKVLEDSSQKEVLRIADNLSDLMEQILAGELKTMRTLAVKDSVIKLGTELARSGENDPKVEAQRVNVAKELTATLKEMGENTYEGVFFLNSGGVILADSHDINFKGLALGERDYFKGAKNGKITIGKVVQSKTSGKGIVPLGAPVLSAAGEFVGAVAVIMKIDYFADKVASTKLGEMGYVFMVNEDGVVIAHPQKDLIFKRNIKELKGAETVAQKMLSKQKGVESYTLEGVDRIAGFAPISLTGWSIAASVARQEFLAPVFTLRNGIIAAGGLFIMLAIVVTMVFARRISRPITKVVEGLNEAARHVSSASNQVSSAGQQLAEGASEQAASIEETSSSLEEMSSMTKQNADNAKQANQLMSGTRETVSRATRSMEKLTSSMGEISKASEETSKIIKTIDEIAFQTNLLALNAAVEAARAGEAGAGFAVVADEVRNLALRAAEAAKNTAALIEGTVKKVKEGSDLVNVTEKEFREVAMSVGKSGDLVGEISAASFEQAQGIEQVNKAVSEMDKVVQQNAANAEETASASEEMNAQAYQIKEFVDELKSLVDGSKAGGGAGINETAAKKKSAASPVRIASTNGKKAGANLLIANEKDPSRFKAKKTRPEKAIPFDEGEMADF